MTTLKNGRFIEQMATKEDVKQKIEEIEKMVEKYHWQGKSLYPYSFRINIMDLIEGWKDFPKCTFDSKQLIISEINGAIKIFNTWEEYELEDKVQMVLPNGKETEVGANSVEAYLEMGAKMI